LEKTFVKVLLVLLVTVTAVNKSLAFTDTTKNVLLASENKLLKKKVLKEANVVYPEILTPDMEKSLAYVEKFAAARRGYLERTYKKSRKFFPKVIPILKKHNVPAEFAVLMALESGFNANAQSGAGAVGYWQIMDDVAREYGMRIADRNAVATVSKTAKGKSKGKRARTPVDDRKNFLKSTYVAAKYLRDRCRNLNGDWLLIAASYNYGVGNVWNALQRTGKANPDFWDIKNALPAETRAYVMNFIALNVIFKNFEKFAGNELCFRPITKNTGTDIRQDKLAQQLMID